MIIFPESFSEKIRKELIKYCKRLEVFFGVSSGDFTIIEVPSRSDFNEKIGRQTPNWHVGLTREKEILILNYNKFETESTHKKEEFIQILKHEICHIYICELSLHCSRSLEEGLCLNFAGQKREAIIKKENADLFFGKSNFYNILDYKNFTEMQGYQLSYMTVKNLLDTFDRKQIIDLIKISKQDVDWKEKIEHISGMTFDKFLTIMKKGIKTENED